VDTYPIKDPTSIPWVDETDTIRDNTLVLQVTPEHDTWTNDRFVLDPAMDSVKTVGSSFSPSFVTKDVYGYVMDDGLLLGHRFFLCNANNPTASKKRLLLNSLSLVADVAKKAKRHVIDPDVLYIVGAAAGYTNYYHWINQCLPAIELGRRIAQEQNTNYRIVMPPLNRWRVRSLKNLGVEADEYVILEDDEFMLGAKMLYTSPLCGTYNFNPTPEIDDLLRGYREQCLSSASDFNPSKRIYITRKDSGKRRLKNESELMEALSACGFEEIMLSKLTIDEQARAFNQAEIIVAPHGAGLTNLTFATAQCHLIEIMPDNYVNPCFFKIAQFRGMSYHQILAKRSDVNDGPDPSKSVEDLTVHETSNSVDIDHVLQAVHLHTNCLQKIRA